MATTRNLFLLYLGRPSCSCLSSSSLSLSRAMSTFHFNSIPTYPGLARCNTGKSFNSARSITHEKNKKEKKCSKKSDDSNKSKKRDDSGWSAVAESFVKRRTRSDREFMWEHVQRYGSSCTHIPVMLGDVLEVFAPHPHRPPLHSFVDCTVGAAGHSSAIIHAHSEMQLFVGLDVDPLAHEKAHTQIYALLNEDCNLASNLNVYTFLKNFKDIKSVLCDVDEKLLIHGVDGFLMDLGISSMQVNNAERGFGVLSDGPLDMRMNPQASLKAEDILNFWPEAEVGRILREYGEESNWQRLQKKIVNARLYGGLHSTGELVDLIQKTFPASGGRKGWIKTATRVFQALRIAVNNELQTLEDALYACFDCLSSGGRLVVISFHSLEDRIVKQTFLDIIDNKGEEIDGNTRKGKDDIAEESWIKQKIKGRKGTILTKRPITPSEEEERLNRRCRSAKLRVIQKV
ncbi:ribosomal RNA small subunit methyltransferase H [Macadamia integrifolia]|uniref:ribosomal RNA small subunit methyltransferase H n=1 Tax=Macadamia integrifolia TaxID=60698 RepID=UPI001C53049F|nr:ribosomal RNA small subunit methyltransferase H [Macadamia integrifolia]